MRVLFTVHRFWPHVGGTEASTLDLGRELRKLGHEVTVATSLEDGSPERESVDGLEVVRFPLRHIGKFRVPPKAYRDFVLGGDWDVIHVRGQRVWSTDHLMGHLRASHHAKVFTAHGFHQWHMHRRDPLELWYYEWHLPRMLRSVDKVVALTGNELEELVGFGVPREKIAIVPEGVNVAEFERAPPIGFRERHGIRAKHMLLYAGGFYDNKRVDFLVRALAAVKSDAELVITGKDHSGGAYRAACEAIAQATGARVRILGQLDRADLVSAFFEADLFLLASRFEGYGIVLIESLAAGVPFVSTPAGAAPDLARAGAGVTVRTPEEMARAVDDLLGDDARRAALGSVGRRLARAQTITAMAKAHEAIYASITR